MCGTLCYLGIFGGTEKYCVEQLSPHHITSRHITSHHITSHHITSHHITSHVTTSQFRSHHTSPQNITITDAPRKHNQPPPNRHPRPRGWHPQRLRFGHWTGWLSLNQLSKLPPLACPAPLVHICLQANMLGRYTDSWVKGNF